MHNECSPPKVLKLLMSKTWVHRIEIINPRDRFCLDFTTQISPNDSHPTAPELARRSPATIRNRFSNLKSFTHGWVPIVHLHFPSCAPKIEFRLSKSSMFKRSFLQFIYLKINCGCLSDQRSPHTFDSLRG